MNRRYWHYWMTLLLTAALMPILRRLHLPFSFDWKTLGIAYWIVLDAQSIFVAVLLGLIGLSPDTTIKPLLRRYNRQPVRFLLLVLYAGILFWAFGWVKALVLTVDTFALIEFFERHAAPQRRKLLAAILLPALYLFCGFLLVFAYNCVIVSLRFNFAYDAVFNAADKWILHGWSVSDLSHWAVRRFPLSFFQFLEFIYFGMFPQIGAAILLVAIHDGRDHALQYIGTILTAYYLALGMFYLWPSQSPYYLCLNHFSRFPESLQAYRIQLFLNQHAVMLSRHVPIRRISTDYFIAFPCMHIAQPLIVMWFLRRWNRMLIVLGVYDMLLIVAILLLEWHYFVDILGGIVVAAVAIAITAVSTSRHPLPQLHPEPILQETTLL
jgi:PAP2 superfamily